MRQQHYVCTIENCGRRHKSRGYCATHYAQYRRGDEITPTIAVRRKPTQPDCIEEGCSAPVEAKGLCQMHYMRTLRHGHTKYPVRKFAPKICRIDGCDNWLYSKGLCHKHHMKERKALQYGITLEQWFEMIRKQDGKCAICKLPSTSKCGRSGKIKDLAVDHCHETGSVRKLLCDRCNRGIGLFQDDTELLQKAIDYLNEHRSLQ